MGLDSTADFVEQDLVIYPREDDKEWLWDLRKRECFEKECFSCRNDMDRIRMKGRGHQKARSSIKKIDS